MTHPFPVKLSLSEPWSIFVPGAGQPVLFCPLTPRKAAPRRLIHFFGDPESSLGALPPFRFTCFSRYWT